MFSVSEIQEAPEYKNISMFKAWWDILMDYLVAATALNVLLLLARMASVDTGGLICVNPFINVSFGYVESRYINSRCCSESNAWVVIFHPYIMLLMWMCITACHICWIKIPAISTKMEAFYAILYKIFTTQPKFYRNPATLRMTTELSYSEANQRAIDILLNKLLYLMTEKPFLRYSYIAKHFVVCVLCIISVVHALFVIAYLTSFPSSFACRLAHVPPTMRGYPFQNGTIEDIPCHLNIAPFVYVIINVDCVIRVVMIGLSIKGMLWAWRGRTRLKKIKNRYAERSASIDHINTESPRRSHVSSKDDENPFGEAAEYLSGMPSYPDLLFCIKLLKRNVHDGDLMYEAICASIKNYVKKLKTIGESYKKKAQAELTGQGYSAKSYAYDANFNYQPKSYHEYIMFVEWMAHELGLEQVPNSLDSNNLFECLLFIKNSLGFVNLTVETMDMREQVVRHLRTHPELYKTLIDEDPDFETYEAHCDKLGKSTTFGSYYTIQAASTMFNVKIIIIHCEALIKIPEVYVPLRHSLLLTGNLRSCVKSEQLKSNTTNVPTRFLIYIAPHFYNATVDMPISPDWPHIVSRRMNYSVDRKYRWDLRQSALRSVILQRNSPRFNYEKMID